MQDLGTEKFRSALSYDARSFLSIKYPVSPSFDERKDHTICSSMVNSKDSFTEEHIILTDKPKTTFFVHVTLSSSSAVNTRNAIVNFFLGEQYIYREQQSKQMELMSTAVPRKV